MENILEVKGINEKNILYFNKLGIENIDDLITYYPRKYDSLMRSDMSLVKDGERVVIEGVVASVPTVRQLSPKLKKVMFRVSNDRGIYNIVAFNLVYLLKVLHISLPVVIVGKYERLKNTVTVIEVRIGDGINDKGIIPIYRTTEGIKSSVIYKAIMNVLDNDYLVKDYIPKYFIDKYKFSDKKSSIKEIHKPSSSYNFRKAKQRIKYEEFFWYLYRIRKLKSNNKSNLKKEKLIVRDKIEEFINNLAFKLTKDQLSTIEEIFKDMESNKIMNRLVQGDVGCGKTIVAFIGVFANYLAGYQSALMVPTEILASQHYKGFLSLFKDSGINVKILNSNVTKKERNLVVKGLCDGSINFVIGTHSLIQKDIIFNKLGLVIIDEQHRFGVNQRQALKDKGKEVDVLSMSATPIPRTYALTIYGDMDISSIKTKPKARKEVSTFYKKETEIIEVLGMMKKELDLGHQIYVVAPSIENENGEDLDNVMLLEEKMKLAFGRVCKIGTVYGKMEALEKTRVMNGFESGDIKILISTTVIEVGVNVPNASMIVIFQANLFGLSTLHQLRGRVGRGDIQSYCILISVVDCERLKILESTSDGFLISEYDFKTRGEGDLFGLRQSGNADFKLADIKEDYELLVRVKEDVDYYCKEEERV